MTNSIRNNSVYNVQNGQKLQNIAAKRAGGGFDAMLQQEIQKADGLPRQAPLVAVTWK